MSVHRVIGAAGVGVDSRARPASSAAVSAGAARVPRAASAAASHGQCGEREQSKPQTSAAPSQDAAW
jgi:hypothetical protein